MILVTGATGLVGGHLVWHLLQENKRVKAIKRKTSNIETLKKIFEFYTSAPESFLERIDWVIADVLDKDTIKNAMLGVEDVYHCAAVVSLGNGSDALKETNIIGTRNLVEVSMNSNVRKFCFVSSIAACGRNTNNEPIDENTILNDAVARSAYSQSKFYSEEVVWEKIGKGLNAVIVNPGVILGFSGTETGSSKLFSQVRKGLKFYTDGGSGYVDVQDVVKAMILLMKSDISAERFVLVAENCSNKEILSWMADGFQKPRPVIKLGKKFLLAIGYVSEISGKVFGFQPLIDRGMAKAATNREYYSGKKILEKLQFDYSSIENCISEVCRFISNQSVKM